MGTNENTFTESTSALKIEGEEIKIDKAPVFGDDGGIENR